MPTKEAIRRSNDKDWARQLADPEYHATRLAQKRASAKRIRATLSPEARERVLERDRRSQAKRLEQAREVKYQRRYGITIADFDRMMIEQGGVCALCDEPPKDDRRLAIDHCHTTGAVRGLLCTRCNSALERVEMSGWAARAEKYLQRVPAEG